MGVSSEMIQHLQGTTSLCIFLSIIARDGTTLRVCNATRNKILGGETYYAYPVAPSRLQATNGLKADNLEVTAIYSELFNSATLRQKKWSGARVEYKVMNYRDPSMGYAERRVGFLGKTSVGDRAATPELMSLSSRLDQPIGRTFQADCDVVELGDARCGINLAGNTATGYRITIAAHVSAVLNRQQFSVAFDENIKPAEPVVTIVPDAFYERGRVEFNSGANEGVEAQILGNDGNGLTLYLPVFKNIATNDQLTLIAGCNRKIATCRDRFANGINFRGFFMLPGRDALLKIPEI